MIAFRVLRTDFLLYKLGVSVVVCISAFRNKKQHRTDPVGASFSFRAQNRPRLDGERKEIFISSLPGRVGSLRQRDGRAPRPAGELELGAALPTQTGRAAQRKSDPEMRRHHQPHKCSDDQRDHSLR
ncbi:hypothetical protein CEXT_18341 [Caerostris extrusa]|uniref:Uncharacterized protein n=1 Tax=Caerostris extrusa TaxID=172846 RepID=A0AAV4Y5R6_CAEEX|nr:hypothetical protein CEXT_18341 [Caerostris extrusa]